MCDCQSYNLPESSGSIPEVILNHDKYFPDTQRPTICVDACIAEVIENLWKAGIRTRGSCCGHNDRPPSVILDDQRHFLAASYLLMKDGRPWRVYVDFPDLRAMADKDAGLDVRAFTSQSKREQP